MEARSLATAANLPLEVVHTLSQPWRLIPGGATDAYPVGC